MQVQTYAPGTEQTAAGNEMEAGVGESRHCMKTKKMMLREPALLKALLAHLTEGLTRYAIHQIDCGAQVRRFYPTSPCRYPGPCVHGGAWPECM